MFQGMCAPLALAVALAATAAPAETLKNRSELTGDWNGVRTWLADRGIVPYASYATGVWANVHGGIQTGARYEGFADWGVDLDLERLAGWHGASFRMGWHSYHGGLPSEELVGNFSSDVVLDIESAVSVRFYDIYLEQRFWNDALLVKAGQISIDEDFFVSRYAGDLLNAAFAFFGGSRGQQLAPFFPLAAPGVYARARFSPRWEMRVGAYTAGTGQDTSSNHGFGWNLHDGASFAAEIATERRPAGRPGRYTLGVLGTTTQIPSFAHAGNVRGLAGLYAMFDQALVIDAEGEPKLGAFLRAGYNLQLDRAILRSYGNAGLALFAPFPGRRDDAVSVGVSFADFAPDYLSSQRDAGEDVTSHESIVELSYRATLTGWLVVQPDVQLVLDPHFSRRDATVLGLQATITF